MMSYPDGDGVVHGMFRVLCDNWWARWCTESNVEDQPSIDLCNDRADAVITCLRCLGVDMTMHRKYPGRWKWAE